MGETEDFSLESWKVFFIRWHTPFYLKTFKNAFLETLFVVAVAVVDVVVAAAEVVVAVVAVVVVAVVAVVVAPLIDQDMVVMLVDNFPRLYTVHTEYLNFQC